MKFTLIVILVLFPIFLFAQPKKEKLTITHLTKDFYIYTTYQSYQGYLVPANGMYLITNKGVVLFDTPWDATQFQPLLDSIEKRHHQKVVMSFATHSHEDRSRGLDYYKQQGIKTYTTRQTDQILKARGAKRAEYLIDRDTTFSIGQYSFQTFYPGPGHTSDNIVIWFEKEKIIYGGCFIKSTEAKDLGNLADANVKEWPNSIRKTQALCKNPIYVIPGHQDWSNSNSLEHTLQLINDYQQKGNR